MKDRAPITIAVLLWICSPSPRVSADFVPISEPNSTYLSATTNIAITQPDFTRLSSVSDSNETVSFSSALQTRTAPTTWNAWSAPPYSESSTPRVLFTGTGGTSVTLAFSQAVTIFGVEMEPNRLLGQFPLEATFYDGSTVVGTIEMNINGNGGARLFAASTSDEFTSVVLSAPSNALGFGIAEIRYAIPTPSTAVLIATAMPLLGPLLRSLQRRRRTTPQRNV